MASVALKSYENRIYKILHWLIQIEDESFLSARLHTHISVDLLFDSKFPTNLQSSLTAKLRKEYRSFKDMDPKR